MLGLMIWFLSLHVQKNTNTRVLFVSVGNQPLWYSDAWKKKHNQPITLLCYGTITVLLQNCEFPKDLYEKDYNSNIN